MNRELEDQLSNAILDERRRLGSMGRDLDGADVMDIVLPYLRGERQRVAEEIIVRLEAAGLVRAVAIVREVLRG